MPNATVRGYQKELLQLVGVRTSTVICSSRSWHTTDHAGSDLRRDISAVQLERSSTVSTATLASRKTIIRTDACHHRSPSTSTDHPASLAADQKAHGPTQLPFPDHLPPSWTRTSPSRRHHIAWSYRTSLFEHPRRTYTSGRTCLDHRSQSRVWRTGRIRPGLATS